ncbi:hypothetical protein [Deinococcus hopiensis]|uniref:Uncharacterized protein n=1 Tax=Deinococcus hopiensis KR-140 TaxID=695939 RepID=A0A1W1V5Z8_9DEIO|nr:hypothetical protein [Deinococcus hopiensis]SMB88706.1 hypothetical protein SAMN00790413_00146 [Deinococcus hopiensis KR-140]
MPNLGTRSVQDLRGARVDALQALKLGVRAVERASSFALAFRRLGRSPAAGFPARAY